MIVPMKKVFLILRKKDVVDALNCLRDLATVHVEHQEPLKGYQINEFREEDEALTEALRPLNERALNTRQEICQDWREPVNQILQLLAEIERYQEAIRMREFLIALWEPWGDFQPQDFERLASNGMFVHLYKMKKGDKDHLPEGAICQTVFTKGGEDYCVVILKSDETLPLERIKPLEMSISQMCSLNDEDRDKIRKAEKIIDDNYKYRDFLMKTVDHSREMLNIEEVATGMQKGDQLHVLKGFAPHDHCKQLQTYAQQQGWGLLIEDPKDDDHVPTYLRNPKWIELIRPVIQFVDLLPGYREVDVSLIFLIFFSIFFGMLVGDAAYGLIFMGITFTVHMKVGKKFKEKTFFYLMYMLSTMAIIWGVLTGTFFGQIWLTDKIQPVVPWLTDMNHIIFLCFIIAAVHLSIAHIWQIILRFPAYQFLAQIGWLSIVWVMFFAANMFVLNTPFPAFALPMLIAGGILVVFFTKPNKNPFKAIGPGLANFLMNFINSFADVVSYIRLFAVGLATVAIADAFNEIATGVGFNSIFAGVGASLILIVGHSLNMILAGLAVLVHGIRLNVLEFPGHLNLEWGGISYKPFKKVKS